MCLAGLCHSICGTKTFLPAALTTESRDNVTLLIGERAEALVFILGMSDRKRLLLENQSPPYCWIDHRTGETIEIDNNLMSILVEIEVANFIEQIPFLTEDADSVIRDMRHRFETTISRMSASAREAFGRVFDVHTGNAYLSVQQIR